MMSCSLLSTSEPIREQRLRVLVTFGLLKTLQKCCVLLGNNARWSHRSTWWYTEYTWIAKISELYFTFKSLRFHFWRIFSWKYPHFVSNVYVYHLKADFVLFTTNWTTCTSESCGDELQTLISQLWGSKHKNRNKTHSETHRTTKTTQEHFCTSKKLFLNNKSRLFRFIIYIYDYWDSLLTYKSAAQTLWPVQNDRSRLLPL